jgi:hypothetical protein
MQGKQYFPAVIRTPVRNLKAPAGCILSVRFADTAKAVAKGRPVFYENMPSRRYWKENTPSRRNQ